MMLAMLYHPIHKTNDSLVFPVSLLPRAESRIAYLSCIYRGRVMKDDDYNLILKYIIWILSLYFTLVPTPINLYMILVVYI